MAMRNATQYAPIPKLATKRSRWKVGARSGSGGDFIGRHSARLQSFTSSLRLRYFGPRYLTSDGIYHQIKRCCSMGRSGINFIRNWRVSGEFLNLLNRSDHDIDYAYTSQITPTSTPAFTDVFHPVEPFLARFQLERTWGYR